MKITYIITTLILDWTIISGEPQKGNNPSRVLTVEIVRPFDWIRLSCTIPEGTSHQWRRYFTALPLNSSKGKDNSLLIERLSYKDSGLYGCTACSEEGCSSLNVTLEVSHKISEESMVNKSVIVGGAVEFDCELNVEPSFPYKVEFYHYSVSDRHDLKFLRNLTALNKRGTKKLELKNVTFENSGWYSCVINHLEMFQFDNSEEVYKIHNYIAFKKAYLQVLNQPHSMTTFTVIGIVSVVFMFLLFSAAITHKLIKQKRTYYSRWVKVVKVTRPIKNTDPETFQMPAISIEKRQSIEIMNDSYESAPVLEYEFPMDWEWEFPREKLTLVTKLGEGAFGRVFMARADGLMQEGATSSVAVKMLKDECSEAEILDLVCELEIMKIIGKHPNVVSLLGSCALNGPLYVIMEFAVHGNLKDFLHERSLRKRSDLYRTKTLAVNHLVTFGLQIAAGMQYLSSMKYIHRDLAARNILVCEGFTMKISDFGLSRDVHNKEYYRKRTSEKLPIRWMAPESLEELVFDAKTDVWSFGVLLWEIMTLGRRPYTPAISWEHLLVFLRRGYRLVKPADCPDAMYEIMRKCWQYEARNRPTFEQLRASIERVQLEIVRNMDVSKTVL